jgi:hypothetical protein
VFLKENSIGLDMAFIKHSNVSFNDIRVILCCEGFQNEKGFVVKEIGYKSSTLNGSIGFNTQTNLNGKYLKTSKFLLIICME